MAKEKAYTAKEIINSSRFVRFILEIRIRKIEKLCVRIDEIISENKELCTQKNFQFMSNATMALVLYEMFRNEGCSKLQAYYNVARPMWEYCGYEAWAFYKKHRFKNAYDRLSQGISEKVGERFDINWQITASSSSAGLCLECSECFYNTFFERYGLKDIAAMFCYSDEIVYGQIKGAAFKTEKTLVSGAASCVFYYNKT